MAGGDGTYPLYIGAAAGITGMGGNAPRGGGVTRARTNAGPGLVAAIPGSGAGGAMATTTTGQAGAAGARGQIVVTEFF
jgi:hypothetical protein